MEAASRRMLAKVWQGAAVIGVVYIFTYTMTVRTMNGPGEHGLDWSMGPPLAFLLIVVPYLAGGFYCRDTRAGMPKHYPFLTALVAALVERLFILGMGALLFFEGGDGSMEGISLMMFIQGEAAPYFGWEYITFGGGCSIAITSAVGTAE